jgi:prevent-host-death family protein
MESTPAVQPITYLKNRTAQLVREVTEDGRTVTITQNGKAKVVVMDIATYERWRAAMALLKILAHAEADVTAGRVLTQGAAFRRAEAAIESAARDA